MGQRSTQTLGMKGGAVRYSFPDCMALRSFGARLSLAVRRHTATLLPHRQTMSSSVESRIVAPYGAWKSPITAEILTQKNVSFGEIAVAQQAGGRAVIAFIENRPQEAGRAAIIRRSVDLKTLKADENDEQDVTGGQYNARSGVHEYGGGALSSPGGDVLLFTDYKTFGVFEASGSGAPKKLTTDNKALRYADFAAHPEHPIIICVQEDHTIDKPENVVNTLVCINKTDSSVHELVAGSDFFSHPRISPTGDYIAWVSWNHPSMPFFATQLWVAKLVYDRNSRKAQVEDARLIGSKTADEVSHHPVWLSEDTLLFGNDGSGFLNLYKVNIAAESLERQALLPHRSESEFLTPAWVLNISCFVVLGNGWLACAMVTKAITSLALLHAETGELRELQTPFIVIDQLRAMSSESVVFAGTQTNEPNAIVTMDLSEAIRGSTRTPRWGIIKRSSSVVEQGIVPREYLTKAEAVEFPTELPDGTKTTAHAVIFPPCNPKFIAPAGTSPPCIVKIHGGPTACATAGLNLSLNYWTSKGYMVCMVNYGGSTGYGREFMLRLDGQWGVVDVRDAVAAATYLGSSQSARANSTSTSRGFRRVSGQAQMELGRLKEREMPSGAVEFTLDNPGSWTVDLTDAALTATLSAAGAFIPGIQVYHGLVAAGAAWLFRKLTHVQRESVMAIPTVGLQLTTLRGFTLPWRSGKSSKEQSIENPTTVSGADGDQLTFFTTSRQTKLIPRDCILDLFTNEAFRRYGVVDYIAVATQPPAGSVSSSRGAKLDVLFPNLLPRLPVVELVYRKVYPAIFGHAVPTTISSNTDSEKGEFAQSSSPRADPNKIAISGGSAGGYTVLASLCLYPRAFSAGCSSYGVSDIAALDAESHKFESRYTERLMGGSPSQVPDIYRERSPINMADRIKSPVLLLQGDIDKVVPPEQSESIYKILKQNGTKTDYILFKGEGHGFRMAANIKKALEEEEAWYKTCFSIPTSQ